MEEISSDENNLKTYWALLSLFECSFSRNVQTSLQQEVATHIRSIISPQHDCVFEQGFKNKVYSLSKVSYSITSFSRSRYLEIMTVQQWSKCLSLVNLIYSFDLKDAWIMLLLTCWKFKDAVSSIFYFCSVTKLSKVNGLRRQRIIYLKLFSNKSDFILFTFEIYLTSNLSSTV